MRLCPTLLVLWILSPLHAEQDTMEVRLPDGETHVGTLVAETDLTLTIHETFHSRGGYAGADLTYQRSNLDSELDLPRELAERSRLAPPTAEVQVALATWAADHGLSDASAAHAQLALAAAPRDEAARALLAKAGYIQADGRWMKEDDYLASHGLARYRDRIYTQADRARITAIVADREAAVEAAADLDARVARVASTLALDQMELTADQARQAELDAAISADAAQLASATTALASDQKTLEAATKAAASSGRKRRGVFTGPSQGALDVEKRDQSAMDAAQAQIAGVRAKSTADKQARTDLVATIKRLTAEIATVTAQQAALAAPDAAAQTAAQSAAAQADTAIAALMPVDLPFAR